jgi:hypothetical protein
VSRRVVFNRLTLCDDSLVRAQLALSQAQVEKQRAESQLSIITHLRGRLRQLHELTDRHGAVNPPAQ